MVEHIFGTAAAAKLIGYPAEILEPQIEVAIDIDRIIRESKSKVVKFMDQDKHEKRDILSEVSFCRGQISPVCKDAFDKAVLGLVDEYMRLARSSRPMPDEPLRPYKPRESIIDYIRSPEGFGPWLEAGILSRPLIREKSPKAYMALANWLRNHNLADEELHIPTKSETINQAAASIGSPEAMKAARALYERQRYAARGSLNPQN